MLDRDLAELYQVKAIALRQQVKRNMDRFPPDFMFRLARREARVLVSQKVIPSFRSFGGTMPLAFTESGVAMLSSVLNSSRAVQVNIQIMRAFIKLREIMATHADLRRKIEEMETKYDHQFTVVFDAIRSLLEPPAKPKRRIGFVPPSRRASAPEPPNHHFDDSGNIEIR
jgi:hypothetical protein